MIIIHYRFLINCLTLGVVTSPNHPDNYPNNLRRTNAIEVEEGLIVVMQFTAFDVESHSTCYDYVTIKNGDGTTLMEKPCGFSLLLPAGRGHQHKQPRRDLLSHK